MKSLKVVSLTFTVLFLTSCTVIEDGNPNKFYNESYNQDSCLVISKGVYYREGGVETAEIKVFYKNGRVKNETFIERGNKVLKKTYNTQGGLTSFESFINGFQVGASETRDDQGQLVQYEAFDIYGNLFYRRSYQPEKHIAYEVSGEPDFFVLDSLNQILGQNEDFAFNVFFPKTQDTKIVAKCESMDNSQIIIVQKNYDNGQYSTFYFKNLKEGKYKFKLKVEFFDEHSMKEYIASDTIEIQLRRLENPSYQRINFYIPLYDTLRVYAPFDIK